MAQGLSLWDEYMTTYRLTSANAHPTPGSLFAYVNPGDATGKFAIGFDMNLSEQGGFAYTLAPFTFATMLLISEQVLG